MMKARGRIALVLLAFAWTAACSTRMAQNPSPGGIVAVTVRNNYPGTVEVWMLHDGAREPLGTVLGSSSTTFTVPGSRLVSGRMRLIGQPVGAVGHAFSGRLNVGRGDNVTFTIQPTLANSYGEVH